MTINPRSWVLVVERDESAELAVDMVINQMEEDKNLVTCVVVQWNENVPTGSIIITGRYSLYKLIYKGTTFLFIEEQDVVGQIKNDV
jgi:co-chaperonin GroES (HSP10)